MRFRHQQVSQGVVTPLPVSWMLTVLKTQLLPSPPPTLACTSPLMARKCGALLARVAGSSR